VGGKNNMLLKKKFSKLGIGLSFFLISGILSSTLVFASPVTTNKTSPLSTPYGTMTGSVSADVDNGGWYAQTYVTGIAPTVYVNGECKERSTGNHISSNYDTVYNTRQASIYGSTYPSRSVTVFSAHEVRGTGSYLRYCSVSQTF